MARRFHGRLTLAALALAVGLLSAPSSGQPAPSAKDFRSRRYRAGKRRVLHREPPTHAKSAAPKPAEWAHAKPVVPARPLPKGCEALLLREWLRLRCRGRKPATIGLLSGDQTNVSFWLAQGKKEGDGYAEVVMPLRRGDRRIIQLTEIETRSELPGASEQVLGFTLQELWLDTMPGPWVSILEPSPTP
jgi:hypothetical protein